LSKQKPDRFGMTSWLSLSITPVISAHSQPRWYHVVQDVFSSFSIVDLWTLNVASLMGLRDPIPRKGSVHLQ